MFFTAFEGSYTTKEKGSVRRLPWGIKPQNSKRRGCHHPNFSSKQLVSQTEFFHYFDPKQSAKEDI